MALQKPRMTGGGNTSISTSVDRGDTPKAKSSSSSSPSSSGSGLTKPSIKPMTEEERKANQLISSDVDRANGIDRTKEALQKLHNEHAKAQFEQGGSPAVMGPSLMPGALPDTKSMYPEGDFRNHINPDRSLIGTVKNKLDDANENISSYVPSYNEVIAKRDQLEKSNEAFGNKMQLIRDTAHKNERVGNAVDKFADFGKGIYKEVDENPVGVGVTTASMFVGGAAFKVGSTTGRMGLLRAASLTGSGSKMGRGLTITSKAIEPALGVGGLTLTGVELKDKSAEELGRTTPHLIGGLIGGYKGWNAGSKVVGNFQTMGRTEIKLESITDPKVATGEQGFPLTRKGQTPDALVSEFKADSHGIPTDKLVTDKYGTWHGTPEKLPSTVEIINNPTRPTDVGGLYLSPRFSPKFTKISNPSISETFAGVKNNLKATQNKFGKVKTEVENANFDIAYKETKLGFKKLSENPLFASDPIRPSASRVYVNDIGRLPPEFRSVNAAKQFMGNGAKPGDVYLTPNADKLSIFGSVESEGVLSPKTMLKQFSVGEKYYTKINGRRVPIDTYEVAGVGKKTKITEYSTKTKSSAEIIENSYMRRGSPLPKVYASNVSSGVKSSSGIGSSNPLSSNVKSSGGISSSNPRSSNVKSSGGISSSNPRSSRGSSASSKSSGSSGSNSPILLKASKKSSLPEIKNMNNHNKKKPKPENDAWKYKRTTNKYKSPLDVKVKGGLI